MINGGLAVITGDHQGLRCVTAERSWERTSPGRGRGLGPARGLLLGRPRLEGAARGCRGDTVISTEKASNGSKITA